MAMRPPNGWLAVTRRWIGLVSRLTAEYIRMSASGDGLGQGRVWPTSRSSKNSRGHACTLPHFLVMPDATTIDKPRPGRHKLPT